MVRLVFLPFKDSTFIHVVFLYWSLSWLVKTFYFDVVFGLFYPIAKYYKFNLLIHSSIQLFSQDSCTYSFIKCLLSIYVFLSIVPCYKNEKDGQRLCSPYFLKIWNSLHFLLPLPTSTDPEPFAEMVNAKFLVSLLCHILLQLGFFQKSLPWNMHFWNYH